MLGPKMPAAADVGEDVTGRSVGGLVTQRQVAQIGQHPHAELRASQHADAQDDEEEPDAGERAQGAAPHRRAHDRIRFSTGSRPIRTIAV